MHARSPDDETSAARLTERIRYGGLVVGLLATFIPPTIAILLQWDDASLRDALSLLVPLALVAIGWAQRDWSRRVAFSSIGAYAYAASVVLLDTPDSITWPPIPTSTFAASVVVISGTTGLWGLVGIAASATLCALGVTLQPISTFNISVDFLGGWITPLVAVGLGLSFFITLREWDARAAAFDAQVNLIKEQRREAIEETEAASARRGVDRRIHETVLNTLNAIVVSDSRESVREQCRRDLETLAVTQSAADRRLSAVINDAIGRVPRIHASVHAFEDAEVADEETRLILGDAVTEMLRNVERHSGVLEAGIEVEMVGGDLTISVTDTGMGVRNDQGAHFGLRHTLTASVGSIGGSVSLEPVSPHGTRACIRIPTQTGVNPLAGPVSTDFLLDSRAARIALVSTVWIGLLAVPVAAASFTRPWAITLSYAALVALMVLLIAQWGTAMRRPLSILVMLAALATMAAATVSQAACQTAIPFHWVIFSAAGSTVLVAFAQTNAWTRILVTAIPLAASLAMALTSPIACNIDAVDAAVENALWVIVIVWLVSGLTARVDRYRIEADRAWLDAIQLRARAAAAAQAEERWAQVLHGIDGIVRPIVTGSADPLDPVVQERARRAQARVRSLLEVGQLQDPRSRRDWEAFLDLMDSAEAGVQIEVLDATHRAPGATVFDDLRRLSSSSAESEVTISLLGQSILLSVSGLSLHSADFPAWSLLHADDARGWTLEYAVQPEGMRSSVD